MKEQHIDVIFVQKEVLKAVQERYLINGSELEVLNAVRYMTLNKGLECSVKCLSDYITGHALFNVYAIVNKLVGMGYLENSEKREHRRRFFLSLGESGQEIVDYINRAISKRMKDLRDNKVLNKKKIKIRVKKSPSGSALVVPLVGEK